MNPRILSALGLAALILGTAAAMKYAQSQGLIDADIADRTMQVVIGLVLAAYANLMPKQIGRPRGSPRADAAAQAALRVGGWSITLAGLTHAALWAFAPLPVADLASMTVVAASLVVTVGYSLWVWRRCKDTQNA